MLRSTIVDYARSFFSVAVTDVSNRGILFVYSVVTARNIGPDNYSIFVLAVIAGNWLWSLVDLGLGSHGIRIIASRRLEQGTVIGLIVSARVTMFLVASFISIFIASYWNVFSSRELDALFWSYAYVLALVIFPAWLYRGERNERQYFFSYLRLGLLILIALFGIVLFNDTLPSTYPIAARNIAWLLAALFSFALLLASLPRKKRFIRPSFRQQFDLLRASLPLGSAAILYSALPLTFIAWVQQTNRPGQEIGSAAAVMQVYLVLLAGSTVFNNVALPILSRAFYGTEDRKQELINIAGSLVFVGSGAFVVTLVWVLIGQGLLEVMFGPSFRFSSSIVSAFGVALFVVYLRTGVDSVLIARGRYSALVISGLVALAAMLIAIAQLPIAQWYWALPLAEITLLMCNIVGMMLALRLQYPPLSEG